ncbi:MAG: phospho-sugar mutase [Halanaerobiaceae bacterium]|nr:phospho-sugar mutase [Halanaerobiaceae bacterium]
MLKYKEWLLSDYFDEGTKEELRGIEDNEKEIEDRFYRELDFGTGGLRGVIGAGTNRINKYIIRKVTQGLANYIINYSDDGKERGVVIAYDSRHRSDEFALEAALVLAANGIKVYLFDELRPTPELSFAVRELRAIGGIVITASHNPPEYNGYKVYWEDGGQVVPEKAHEIIAEINEIDDFELVKWIDREEALEKGLLEYIGEEIDDRYIEEMLKVLDNRELALKKGKELSIIYTPLHGTGYKPVKRILTELGFGNLHIIEEQAVYDPDFSTVKSPNPEDFSVFKMALDRAEKYEPDLIIGTDPDGDRVGIVVKDLQGNYVGLTGNQVGVLLSDYILDQLKKADKLPENGVIIKTIVSTEMAGKVAENYGIELMDVLTGFKFIGEKIKEFEESGDKTFIFGFEESYGYLAGTYARDKDAIVATALIALMTLNYKEKGQSLYEHLIELMDKYGYYKEGLSSIMLEGKEGQEKIKNVLIKLRREKQESFCGIRIIEYSDYLERRRYNCLTGEETEIHLPESDVLQYRLEDDSILTIRPSGTEPKLKIYFMVKGNSKEDADKRLSSLQSGFLGEINEILDEL